MAITAITTSSSINVNARRSWGVGLLEMFRLAGVNEPHNEVKRLCSFIVRCLLNYLESLAPSQSGTHLEIAQKTLNFMHRMFQAIPTMVQFPDARRDL
jgi:hypothetical protein